MIDWRKHIHIKQDPLTYPNGKSVFIIRAGNIADRFLFTRASQPSISQFTKHGFTVYLLDIDVRTDYPRETTPPCRNLSRIIQDAFLNIPNLFRIQFYSHARHDINLTEGGAELSSIPIDKRESDPYNSHRLYIGDLKIGNPAAGIGLIDMFTCITRPQATWPQLLADSTGWCIRTVAPGYSIYFPENGKYPRAQLPSNRIFRFKKYDPRGWALWMPGWNCFIPTSQPDGDEFCTSNSVVAHMKTARTIATLAEPFRKWRVERMRKRGRRELQQLTSEL